MADNYSPNIPLAFRPTDFSAMDLGASAKDAQAMIQGQQMLQEVKRQNALRGILGAPGAIDPTTGAPTPQAMQRVMGVDPNAGLKLQQNALMGQQQQLRMQGLRSDLFAKKLDNMYDIYAPILETYEDSAKGGMPEPQARAAAQEALDAANKQLTEGGMYSPQEAQRFLTQFDPTKMYQFVVGSKQYQDWRRTRVQENREAHTAARGAWDQPKEMQWAGEGGQPQAGMLQFNKDDGKWYTTGENPQVVQNPQTYKTPAPGSNAETLTLIEEDLANDENWKDKKPGERRQEAMRQMQVVQGKMTTPEQQDKLAKEIASYRIAPMSSFAMASPRGQAVMAKVAEYNPDYQAQRYGQIGQVMNAFGKGPEGRTVRSMNVAIQHLDVMEEAGKALKNGDMQTFNALGNRIAQEFGYEAPTTYDALRRIVGTEIEKAVAGGVGALPDREDLLKALNRANSPEQMAGVINGFKNLMAGQLNGLKTQYEAGTGFKDDSPFAFKTMVEPNVLPLLGRVGGDKSSQGGQPAAQPTTRQDGPAAAAPAKDLPRIGASDKAAYDALPPGAEFIAPNGAVIRKPGAAPQQSDPAKEQPKQQTQPAAQPGEKKATPASYTDGMTATNPKTGEKMVFRGGEWVPLRDTRPGA